MNPANNPEGKPVSFFGKYIFPPLYGAVVYFTIRLLLDTVTGMKFWRRHWQLQITEFGATVLYSYMFVWLFRRLLRWFDRRWPVNDISTRRIMRELGYLFLLNLIFQNLFLTTMAAVTDDGLQWYDLADINTIPLLYSLICYGIVRSQTFLQAYIAERVQLQKITTDHLETELKFLKAQYHPHFLFNALNTIYFQMDEDIAAAKKSVEKFSELLRYQLYDQQQTVPVCQEIHYLQNFVQLQQTRSSEKLQLSLQLDKMLQEQKVYPLLFLPLVENAFKYVGGSYRLCIKAALQENNIVFQVINDTPTDLAALPARLTDKKAKGIGLENLQRRLALLYPGRHQLLTQKKDNTFIAELTLQYQ